MVQSTQSPRPAEPDGAEALADILPRLIEALDGRTLSSAKDVPEESPTEADAELAAVV